MEKEKYLSYCVLYCDLCGARCRTPSKAKELADTLRRGEFEEWGRSFPEFNDFWKLLKNLSDVPEDKCCKTMKSGHPDCSIRKCVIQTKLKLSKIDIHNRRITIHDNSAIVTGISVVEGKIGVDLFTDKKWQMSTVEGFGFWDLIDGESGDVPAVTQYHNFIKQHGRLSLQQKW